MNILYLYMNVYLHIYYSIHVFYCTSVYLYNILAILHKNTAGKFNLYILFFIKSGFAFCLEEDMESFASCPHQAFRHAPMLCSPESN